MWLIEVFYMDVGKDFDRFRELYLHAQSCKDLGRDLGYPVIGADVAVVVVVEPSAQVARECDAQIALAQEEKRREAGTDKGVSFLVLRHFGTTGILAVVPSHKLKGGTIADHAAHGKSVGGADPASPKPDRRAVVTEVSSGICRDLLSEQNDQQSEQDLGAAVQLSNNDFTQI
jgi:hypothetical protein